MFIESISVKGPDKPEATVNFRRGLNVIAGASDTGKSYILKCIDYILGSENAPKPIRESQGYTHVEAKVQDDDGMTITLSREIGEKTKVTCRESNGDDLVRVLNPGHKGAENLSDYFMGKLGLANKILVKGVESLSHSTLTLRLLGRIFLVDESRIIAEHSPLGTGQNSEKTLELSMLKTLLTGDDDSSVLDMKQRQASASSLEQKIESLTEFMNRFLGDAQEGNVGHLDAELAALEEEYERLEERLNSVVSGNEKLIARRQGLVDGLNKVSSRVADEKTLTLRFEQLKEKFQSDQERLIANSEATIYLEQQILANCPTCGHVLGEDDDLEIELILESNKAELEKISQQVGDLNRTIAKIRESVSLSEQEANRLEEEVKQIDKQLDSSIGKAISEDRKVLGAIGEKKAEIRSKIDQVKRRNSVAEEIGNLRAELGEPIDRYEIRDISKETNKLAKTVSEILQRWGFPEASKVNFERETRDIAIAGKRRSLYGKGYRAVTFTAFLIGLMEELKVSKSHPGFVLFDSPLTTYRQQDEEETSEEVVLTNDLIYAFYRDLADSYKDSQIIVLENQEPDSDLHALMNYVHFSGNESIGRYGFFPNE